LVNSANISYNHTDEKQRFRSDGLHDGKGGTGAGVAVVPEVVPVELFIRSKSFIP
jgi:hypothetical protein